MRLADRCACSRRTTFPTPSASSPYCTVVHAVPSVRAQKRRAPAVNVGLHDPSRRALSIKIAVVSSPIASKLDATLAAGRPATRLDQVDFDPHSARRHADPKLCDALPPCQWFLNV